MPRIQRSHGAAIIEVSIPLSLSRRSDDADDNASCFICAHPFCAEDVCHHSATQLQCCSQPLCCGCAIKVARRCKCTEECEAVIAICPFCRDIVPLAALEIFQATQDRCKQCLKIGEDEALQGLREGHEATHQPDVRAEPAPA